MLFMQLSSCLKINNTAREWTLPIDVILCKILTKMHLKDTIISIRISSEFR